MAASQSQEPLFRDTLVDVAGHVLGRSAGAVFSPDRAKRFLLWRPTGAPGSKILTSLMLNPSDANEVDNDPTVRWLLSFGRTNGFAQLRIGNLYPWVTSSPKVLATLTPLDGLDVENFSYVVRACEGAFVLCAWGASAHPQVAKATALSLTKLGVQLHALGFTKSGQPWHPLRKSLKLQPRLWTP